MITQAYFEDGQSQIKQELASAQASIIASAVWFNDPELFETLCRRAEDGIRISLAVLDDRRNKTPNSLDINSLIGMGASVHMIEPGSEWGVVKHKKFFVIDAETVITGSYTSAINEQHDDEHITVIKDCADLAADFICEFNNLLAKRSSKNKVKQSPILKRLQILKNIIELHDEDDIAYQLDKLKKQIPTDNRHEPAVLAALEIIECIENKAYENASRLIQKFPDDYNALSVWADPELPGLKLELRVLELEIYALQNEKADMEKLIREFDARHNAELGQIMLEILKLRKSLAQSQVEDNPQDEEKQEQYQEASQDYDEYQQGYEEERLKPHHELSTDQKHEIKDKYRKASKLCHPDAVAQEYADAASEMFKKLNDAYTSNDLETVEQILEYLETGSPFAPKHLEVKEIDKLKSDILGLRMSIKNLLLAIAAIKNSTTYNTIIAIDDWQEYFDTTKQSLLEELERLREEWQTISPN